MNEDDALLRARLRGLAADAELAAVPRAPEEVRARGTRRRNRLRAAGASVALAAVFVAAAWVARPDADTAPPASGAASTSTTPTSVPGPSVASTSPPGPNSTSIPPADASPTRSPIDRAGRPVLPSVPGANWAARPAYSGSSGGTLQSLTDLLYDTCPGSDAIVLPTGTAYRYGLQGSEVRQWWVDLPEARPDTAIALVDSMSAFADDCFAPTEERGGNPMSSSAIWQWGDTDVGGRLLIARRGTLVAIQISRMTAPIPDIEPGAGYGSFLLDEVTATRTVPTTAPASPKAGG